MRVTNAGSWAMILCNWLAVLLGSSTVVTIRVVISGSVAIAVTFLTAASTCARLSTDGAAVLGTARVAFDIVGPSPPFLSRGREYDLTSESAAEGRPVTVLQ